MATMTKAELYEEIRALLLEPQNATVSQPWSYTDADLLPQLRSGLRHYRTAMGTISGTVVTTALAPDGTLTGTLTEEQGLFLSYFVAARLLTGDLVRRLKDGELGMYFNAGGDVIDTKNTETAFQRAAQTYVEQAEAALLLCLANADGGTLGVFTGTVTTSAE